MKYHMAFKKMDVSLYLLIWKDVQKVGEKQKFWPLP